LVEFLHFDIPLLPRLLDRGIDCTLSLESIPPLETDAFPVVETAGAFAPRRHKDETSPCSPADSTHRAKVDYRWSRLLTGVSA